MATGARYPDAQLSQSRRPSSRLNGEVYVSAGEVLLEIEGKDCVRYVKRKLQSLGSLY